MTNRLQVGIDFSLKRADFCLLFPDGQPLEIHRAFANAPAECVNDILGHFFSEFSEQCDCSHDMDMWSTASFCS